MCDKYRLFTKKRSYLLTNWWRNHLNCYYSVCFHLFGHHTCCKSSFLSVFLCEWLKGTAWKIDAICTHGEGKERTPQTLTIHLLFVYWFVGAIMSLSPWNEIIQGMLAFIVWCPFSHHSNRNFLQHSILLWIILKI